MEIIQEPKDFPGICENCVALRQLKAKLEEYQGQESTAQTRITCFEMKEKEGLERGRLPIQRGALAVMHSTVFEKGQEGNPNWFKSNWQDVVACPGRINNNPLTTESAS
ncbi:MAG: hypothetical protein M1484_01975 [Patescibacteria group bacterium]|nr:hypothetical protein [Patescibacteria group bacterium]MCL5431849.1 hypothetical protein [Patescibacteria group bacterium]